MASATKTTSGQLIESFDVGDYDELILFATVTAASGTTPTLDLVFMSSPDNTNWFTHSLMTQITATGNTLLSVPQNIGQYCSVYWAIGGTTPSFTFSLDVVAKKRW